MKTRWTKWANTHSSLSPDGNIKLNIYRIHNLEQELPIDEKSSLGYFKQLRTDNLIDLVVKQTSLCSTKKIGTCININKDEIEKLIGQY